MNQDHLGDSFDLVKRFFKSALEKFAPLYADPRFFRKNDTELIDQYIKITGIPLLKGTVPTKYSILFDPDTGIRLPEGVAQGETVTHTTLESIISELNKPSVRCVVVFDQSHYWTGHGSLYEQKKKKLAFLKERMHPAFFYNSHAPFLFVFRKYDKLKENSQQECDKLNRYLLDAGIPEEKILHQ